MRLLKLVPDNTNIDFVCAAQWAFAILSAAADDRQLGAGLHQRAQPRRRLRRRADDPRDLHQSQRRADRRAARRDRAARLWRAGDPAASASRTQSRSACRRPKGGHEPGPGRQDGEDKVIGRSSGASPGRAIDGVDSVSGKVSSELGWTGVHGARLAVLGISIYIWFRFEWQFGVGALVAPGPRRDR